MRFYKVTALVASCFVPSLILAQQSSSPTSDAGGGSDNSSYENGILVALLDLLNEKKGVIVYDDLNQELLRKLSCSDEYNRTSIGTSGGEKGVSDAGIKAHCKDEAVVQYAGRSHFTGRDYFSYMLDIVWSSTSDQCFRADTALKTLRSHGWTLQSMLAVPSEQTQFIETFPNTERFTSKNSVKVVSVTWVPKENPNSLQNVDPSAGCLRRVDIEN